MSVMICLVVLMCIWFCFGVKVGFLATVKTTRRIINDTVNEYKQKEENYKKIIEELSARIKNEKNY